MDTDDAHPLPIDRADIVDADWFGTRIERPRGGEVLELDRDSVERVGVTEARLPDDLRSARRPREVEPVRRPSLTYRDRRGASPADPLYIVNNDDRKQYDDWRYPWGLVCRVDTHDGFFGSGVLVGPRHVLTASHVIDWNNLNVTVEVHAFDTSARATATVDVAGCYTKVTDDSDTSYVDEDYAVLVLDQRLGDRFGWMGVRTYDSGWDDDELWCTVGYSDDVAGTRRPTWQPAFYLDEDEVDLGWGRAMETNADLIHGQSGSAVFAWWPNGPYAVAVVSAQVDGDNYCAGGTGLPSLVNGVRAAHP